jgi:hypothetical protein
MVTSSRTEEASLAEGALAFGAVVLESPALLLDDAGKRVCWTPAGAFFLKIN